MKHEKQHSTDSRLQKKTRSVHHNTVSVEKSRLSLIGLILAIIVPPVGAILSLVALIKIKKGNLRGKGQAMFGLIWGVIFSIPFLVILWLSLVLGGIQGNEAKKVAQPFITQVQKAGGTKLCDNGDGGHGPDNTQAWYEAYYKIPNSPQLTTEIKADAAQLGYSLTKNTQFINQLKTTLYQSSAAPYNSQSDYLTGSKSGVTLSIIINRKTSVPLECGVVHYGDKKPTGTNSAILDINFIRHTN